MRELGAPPSWTPYVNVESAERRVSRARELGAEILMDTMKVEEVGRVAIIRDPTGAVFGLWQTGTHTGAAIINSPGALCWSEARTHDLDAAKEFYTKLFGWGCAQSTEMGGMPYVQFTQEGTQVAGLSQLSGPGAEQTPAHWGITFGVEDATTAIDTATRLGATVTYGPMDIPFGTIAGFVDPQGAHIGVIGLAPAMHG